MLGKRGLGDGGEIFRLRIDGLLGDHASCEHTEGVGIGRNPQLGVFGQELV